MNYSLAAAAEAAGVNKTTILRAIKKGKISASKDEHGEYRIDPAELHRVYPAQPVRSDAEHQPLQQYAPSQATMPIDLTIEIVKKDSAIERLQTLNRYLEKQLEEMREQITDARAERDRWQEQASRALIEYVANRAKQEPRGLFGWFKRAG